MVGPFAETMVIGSLPVSVVAFTLPPPARPCFPDREPRNFNRLHLISFARAYKRG
jgi:hypothetical protein